MWWWWWGYGGEDTFTTLLSISVLLKAREGEYGSVDRFATLLGTSVPLKGMIFSCTCIFSALSVSAVLV
jgi:hypothetical protein